LTRTLLTSFWLGLVFAALPSCSSDEEPTNPTECVNGICGSGATGSGGKGGSSGGKGGSGTGGSGGTGGGSATGGSIGDAGDGGTNPAGGTGGGTGGGNTGGTGGGTGGGNTGGTGGGNTGGSGGATGGSGGSGGATGGSSGSGPCVESWVCTPWQTNGSNNDGMRTCTDANSCGTTAGKPIEAVTLPALDLNFYKCNVEPVMDHKCSMLGCHGTETGRPFRIYARGRLRITGEILTDSVNSCLKQGQMFPSEDCIGSIECRCYFEPHTPTEWRRNYDSARGFALDAAGAPLAPGDEDLSELIAQPIVGGKAHAGIHLFRRDDAEHDTLRRWLSGETLSTCTTNN